MLKARHPLDLNKDLQSHPFWFISYVLSDANIEVQNSNKTYEVVRCKSPKYAILIKQITDEDLILALLLDLLLTFKISSTMWDENTQPGSFSWSSWICREREEVARRYNKQEIPPFETTRHMT